MGRPGFASWQTCVGEVDGAFLPEEYMMRDARRCSEEARGDQRCPRSSVDEIRNMMGAEIPPGAPSEPGIITTIVIIAIATAVAINCENDR